jgi:hypothetical protein
MGLCLLAVLQAGQASALTAPAWPLNDTGIDWCANGNTNFLACPVVGYPGQDAENGRDVVQDDDVDGHAGFAFTKLDANGKALPASATTWSCVRDNVTGLIWEVKTDDSGLRDEDWTYTWFNPDPARNGGSEGTPDGTDNCWNSARCDTDKFAADVNQAGLCGAGDWRLPTREELRSIVDHSRYYPAIDTTYFSDELGPEWWFWSSSPHAYYTADHAWFVYFAGGNDDGTTKGSALHVRLVRGGQASPFDRIGVWRPSTRRFYLDANGNGRWDGAVGGDTQTSPFGLETDIPVTGDWNGDGAEDVGVWRPSTRRFYMDANGNGRWDGAAGGDILTSAFKLATDLPVIGDWNGHGTDYVGFWCPSTRRFYLDANGNGKWDGAAGGDTLTGAFGLATDVPVTGDWNGDGTDDVGFWRPSTRRFYLDANGNGRWDGAAGGDTQTSPFGLATDVPVTGDWNGDGTDDVGYWRPSTRKFSLDANGNDKWDGTAGGDTISAPFILSTDKSVTGRW